MTDLINLMRELEQRPDRFTQTERKRILDAAIRSLDARANLASGQSVEKERKDEIIECVENAIRDANRGADTYIAALIAADAILATPPQASADDVRDAELLDWLDATNKPFKMGWRVGVAPAGNVSISSVIQLGGKISTIRDAITSAIAAERAADEGGAK